MAVNAINQQRMIPGAYVTLVQKDSFPNENAGDQGAVTEAVYASVTLLQQGVIAVIGDISSSWTTLSALMTSTLEIPQCSFTANAIGFSDKSQYKYFYRTIPTKTILADVMLDFVSSQNWINIGVIYSNDLLGQQFYQKVMNLASYKHMNVVGHQPYFPDQIADLLHFVSSSEMRIILVGVTGNDQVKLMTEAAKLNLISSQYVWLLMDDNSANLLNEVQQDNHSPSLDGLFLFDMKMSLNGYPPFEAFLDDWTKLDPMVYPYAGRRNVTTNEGPAYSCMMTMARGFNRTLSTLGNHTLGLEMLSNRSLGSSMTPLTFDTGYISPDGPLNYDSNGDLTRGNHHIYNIQHGNRVSIGHSIAGNLELNRLPMFYDGSFQPPDDSPPSKALNPDFSNPVSQIILAFTGTCMLLCILVLFLVAIYRKHEIFRASSPLFCCLELIGFLFTYVAVVFMIGIPTRATCFIVPISFTFGFLLVLGNLIAKNYRIYRIFNNIFISRKVITDSKLMGSTSIIVIIDMVILIIGLVVTQPVPKLVKLNPTSHYWICEAESSASKTVFLSVGTCYAAAMLTFATFLAYKTRSAGKSYDHFNECKQMGISVYNILFSAIVGFTAMINPLANYYTKFYFGAVATLWATTFSFAVLFIPKVYIFYKQWKRAFVSSSTKQNRNYSNCSENTQRTMTADAETAHSFLKSDKKNNEEGQPYTSSLLFEQTGGMTVITRSFSADEIETSNNATVESNNRYDSTNVYVEVQEGDLPVRKSFRYFPFLTQWKMRRLMIFPRLGYISYYSTQSKKGTMISYTHASVYSSKPEEYVLKIHGQDVHDVFIQLGDFVTMESWQACLNQDIMKQQEMSRKVTITRRRMFSTSSSVTLKHNAEQHPTIVEEDTSDIQPSPHQVSFIRRRRSKSHPSILSQSDNALHPLQLTSQSSSSCSILSSATYRKRRKTSDEWSL
ncbi:periplasmic binding protein-like I, partial [Helicostylum pulchrum]